MAFDFMALEEEARQKIAQAKDIPSLEALRIQYLGRKGVLAEITAIIPTLALEARPEYGKNANLLKNKINQFLEIRARQLKEEALASGEQFDFTLPGAIPQAGIAHPIVETVKEISGIFTKLGFSIAEGPEIETEFNNFTGLNIPLDHPSRDAFDTFYLKPSAISHQPSAKLLLRSHTSPVQIRVMKKYKPPLAVIVPGKVYRPDAVDASHSFMFHQIEGFLVDEDVKFSDLKGVLSVLAKKLFSKNIKMRFRPHFFPFTEPSAEVDISCMLCSSRPSSIVYHPSGRCSVCGGKGWLEIMGCGMIHPNVFANIGYPEGKYTGFAFGMGVERITMLKYGINDIRLFYENDLRFLRQF